MVVCGKTAEPIEMPLALWVRMSPKNHKLDGSPSPMRRGKFLGENGRPIVKYSDLLPFAVENGLNQARRGCSGMPGHVGQNDTDFTLLQEELNAPISRPLRPNFAIGPPFFTNFGGPQPLNGRG